MYHAAGLATTENFSVSPGIGSVPVRVICYRSTCVSLDGFVIGSRRLIILCRINCYSYRSNIARYSSCLTIFGCSFVCKAISAMRILSLEYKLRCWGLDWLMYHAVD